MTPSTVPVICQACGEPVELSGPVVALAGANGFRGPAFVPFVELSPTLGTGGVVHIPCYVARHGERAFGELLHAPKARAMNRP